MSRIDDVSPASGSKTALKMPVAAGRPAVAKTSSGANVVGAKEGDEEPASTSTDEPAAASPALSGSKVALRPPSVVSKASLSRPESTVSLASPATAAAPTTVAESSDAEVCTQSFFFFFFFV